MSVEQPQEDGSSGIGRRMAVGAIWMVALRSARRVIGVVSTIILARLLVPEDFGIVAIASAAIALFEFMSKLSLDLALISKQEVDRDYYDTAFTLQFLRGLIITVLVVGAAGPAAIFFEEPRLENVFYVLAVAVMIDTFVNIRIVDFFKDFNLRKNFQLSVTSALASFATKLTLALIWESYWALVAGFIAESIVRVGLSYWLIPYKPRFCLVHWRWLFNFSKWLMIGNFCEYLSGTLDRFVLGKFVDANTLGLYVASFEISNLPTTNLVLPIQGALFPGYAKIADDLAKLRDSYLNSMAFILMLAVPAGVGIGVAADSIIRVMLGENWLGAIPLLKILVIYGILRLATANSRPIYLAVKRPEIVTYMAGVQLGVLIPCLIAGVSYAGAIGASWGLVVAFSITGTISLIVVHRLLNLNPTRLFAKIWRTGFAAAMLIAAVELAKPFLPGSEDFASALFRFMMIGVIGAVSYIFAHLGAWIAIGRPDGAEFQMLQAIKEKYPKFEKFGLV